MLVSLGMQRLTPIAFTSSVLAQSRNCPDYFYGLQHFRGILFDNENEFVISSYGIHFNRFIVCKAHLICALPHLCYVVHNRRV